MIEEECTGNGTLATARDGVLADAVVLLEPTDLGLLLGGVGILWAELTVRGLPGHAESAHRAVNPVDAAQRLIDSVRALETPMALQLGEPFAHLERACAVNAGDVPAGDWPSSVPGQATVGIRVGFPPAWTPDEALKQVSDAVSAAAAADPWLASRPPAARVRIRPEATCWTPGIRWSPAWPRRTRPRTARRRGRSPWAARPTRGST